MVNGSLSNIKSREFDSSSKLKRIFRMLNPEKNPPKLPAIGLHFFGIGSGVVDALDDAELEVVVGEFGVADDSGESSDFVVELRNGVTALEREPQCVQVFLRVLQHLEAKINWKLIFDANKNGKNNESSLKMTQGWTLQYCLSCILNF